MPKITKRIVDAVEPGERDAFLWDSDVKGFGLKITPAGGKSYVVQYRMGARGATTKRYTIGKHGSPWTADAARDEARRLLALVAAGTDPQAEKEAARVAAATPPPALDTFAIVADRFIERYAKPNTRSWAETKRLLDRHVMPSWGARDVKVITRRDVNEIIDGIAVETPTTANRVLAAVRKLFEWAAEKEIVLSSPCAGVRPPAREAERDRVLSDDELRAVWSAAGTLGYPFGPFVRLLILTAQRRDEVAGMRWSELALETATWTLPANRSKNGKAHEVNLSPQAVAILTDIPRQTDDDGRPVDLIFTTTMRTPISGFSGAKADIDAVISGMTAKAGHGAGRTGRAQMRAEGPGRGATAEGSWRFHDLRRTAATGMAGMGFAAPVVDRILNHVQSGRTKGVAAIYNRYEYFPERRTALNAWGARVSQIVNGGTGAANVVQLRA